MNNKGFVNNGTSNIGNLAIGSGAQANWYDHNTRDNNIQTSQSAKKVLFISANPDHTDHLRLDREIRVVREAIALSKHRNMVELIVREAARGDDLRRVLLNEKPHIVHFSGHGTSKGIVLEDEQGNPSIVSQEVLADLFKRHVPPLECVVLNTCHSISSGLLISLGVPFTIVMEGSILDAAAKEFSKGFYDAIGALLPIEHAYQEGLSAVKIAELAEEFVAHLLIPGPENR